MDGDRLGKANDEGSTNFYNRKPMGLGAGSLGGGELGKGNDREFCLIFFLVRALCGFAREEVTGGVSCFVCHKLLIRPLAIHVSSRGRKCGLERIMGFPMDGQSLLSALEKGVLKLLYLFLSTSSLTYLKQLDIPFKGAWRGGILCVCVGGGVGGGVVIS